MSIKIGETIEVSPKKKQIITNRFNFLFKFLEKIRAVNLS